MVLVGQNRSSPARGRDVSQRRDLRARRTAAALLTLILLSLTGCESANWPPPDMTLWNPFAPKPAGPVKESKGNSGALIGGNSTGGSSSGVKGRILSDRPQQATPEIDPTRTPEHDDVTEIICFWNNAPWRVAQDKPVGFKAPVYFVSGTNGKGAFVPGTIFAYLYEIVSVAPGGRPQRKPIYGWELDREQAMPFRVRKEAVGGNFYGFLLNWSDDVKVEGRTIELEFAYQGKDGRVVTSSPKRFKIPIMGSDAAAAAPSPAKPAMGSNRIRPQRSASQDVTLPPDRPRAAVKAEPASERPAASPQRPARPPQQAPPEEPNYDPQVGP